MNAIHTISVKTASLLLIAATLFSCSDSDDDNQQGPFDRKAMLTNYADNTVIPAYGLLHSKLQALVSSTESLAAEPNGQNLEAAQNSWIEAYRAWQSANAFNFGPAGEQGLQKGLIEEIGTFPVSQTKIEAILETGTYNLNDFNRDARGLLTVEYLLFAPTEEGNGVVERFDNPIAHDFLQALAINIFERVDMVHAEWTSGYRDAFINNNGTDVGSSTSQFYNEFVRSFEALKNFKVGLPLGLRPGQVEAAPHLVEARYSQMSREMMELHFKAIENIWIGRDGQDRDGLGFEDYLQTVVGGPDLIEATKAQIAQVHAAFDAVPFDPSFADQAVNAPENPNALHTELQKQTRFFKSDMSSLLGIAITFSSGDGD
jgi:predicted lipoprotein